MELALRGGHVALFDDEDAERVLALKWHATKRNRTWYAAAAVGPRAKRTTMYLHRLVMNAEPGCSVDHVNHNGLDCRKTNLRYATSGEQNAHRRKQSGAYTSRFKGVHSWVDGGSTRWRASLELAGVERRKYCRTEIDAARAYNELAREAFGEFAVLNDVPDTTKETS